MEKFDNAIKDAKNDYQPRADFVDTTMRRIAPPRRSHMKLWGMLLTGGLALAFVVLPHGGGGASTGSLTTSSGQPITSDQTSTATDNATLTSDLNSIQNAMNTASTDQNSADAALNDSQQQVTIPTE